MANIVARKLRAYTAHAFVNPSEEDLKLANYDDLFSAIAEIDYRAFRIKVRRELVAISDIYETQDYISFLFVRGSDTTITTFNQETGESKVSNLPEGEIAATSSWVIFKKKSRFLFIESKRPGVPLSMIIKYLTQHARKNLKEPRFKIDFHPISGPNFQQEIQRFTRIREVAVVLSRPNHSWSDQARELIGDSADSDADKIDIAARAGRGKTLPKNRGIVARLSEMSAKPITALKNARIFGTVPGVKGEHVASIEKSQLTSIVEVDENASERSNIPFLLEGVSEFDEALDSFDPELTQEHGQGREIVASNENNEERARPTETS